MKLGKRLIALLLVLGVMFCLTACKKQKLRRRSKQRRQKRQRKRNSQKRKFLLAFHKWIIMRLGVLQKRKT